MFHRLFHSVRKALGSILEPDVTRESLAKTYSTFPDNQLRALRGGPLTAMAKVALEAELARRAAAPASPVASIS